MSQHREDREKVRVGAGVVECMIAPHPMRPPAYGRIVEICSTCSEALVRCYNGFEERVPLDRFGKARPQAWWRLTGTGRALER